MEQAYALFLQGLNTHFLEGVPPARAYFEHALQLYEDNSVEPSYREKVTHAKLWLWIGNIELSMLRLEKAQSHFEQAATLLKALNEMDELVHALAVIGAVYLFRGDYEQVLSYWSQALDVGRAGQQFEKRNIQHMIIDIGNILFYLRRYDEAKARFEEVVGESLPQHERCRLLNSYGNLAFAEGKLTRASSLYAQADEMAKQREIKLYEQSIAHNRGNVYRTQGDLSKALGYYQRALDIIEKNLQNEKTREGKNGIVAHSIEFFEAIIELLLELNQPEDALKYVKLGKLPRLQTFFERRLAGDNYYIVDEKRRGEKFGRYYVLIR